MQACWVTERTENVSVRSMLESNRSLSRPDWKCNDAASNVFLGIHHDIVVNWIYSSCDSAIYSVFDSCLSFPHSVLQRSLDALPTAFLDNITHSSACGCDRRIFPSWTLRGGWPGMRYGTLTNALHTVTTLCRVWPFDVFVLTCCRGMQPHAGLGGFISIFGGKIQAHKR